jgi:hypothetical protein
MVIRDITVIGDIAVMRDITVMKSIIGIVVMKASQKPQKSLMLIPSKGSWTLRTSKSSRKLRIPEFPGLDGNLDLSLHCLL